MTELEEYYNKFNEDKRLTRRHGRVEYITSMKYIHACIDVVMKEKNEAGDGSGYTGTFTPADIRIWMSVPAPGVTAWHLPGRAMTLLR